MTTPQLISTVGDLMEDNMEEWKWRISNAAVPEKVRKGIWIKQKS
jgi:hypothetical protein